MNRSSFKLPSLLILIAFEKKTPKNKKTKLIICKEYLANKPLWISMHIEDKVGEKNTRILFKKGAVKNQ